MGMFMNDPLALAKRADEPLYANPKARGRQHAIQRTIPILAVTEDGMLSTGKSDEMLMSLQKSISDLEIAINVTKKDQLDLRQTFYALILFGTAIGLVMYLFMQNLGNIVG